MVNFDGCNSLLQFINRHDKFIFGPSTHLKNAELTRWRRDAFNFKHITGNLNISTLGPSEDNVRNMHAFNFLTLNIATITGIELAAPYISL